MKHQYGAGRSPIIEIAVSDNMRARAKALSGALERYKGCPTDDVPGDLRDQAYALAREAERLIAQAVKHKQGDRRYGGVVLRRNYYDYRTQAVWTGSEDGALYLTYDSCLIGEVSQIIWDPTAWYCWSPNFGVKRDMVTFYGVPAIVHELAYGTILDDMADRPLSPNEARRVERLCQEGGYRKDGSKREDTYPGHAGHEDDREWDEWNPERRAWIWEDEKERADQEWLEHLELFQLEAAECVHNDIYRD